MATPNKIQYTVTVEFGPEAAQLPDDGLVEGLVDISALQEKVMADVLAKFGDTGPNKDVGILGVNSKETRYYPPAA